MARVDMMMPQMGESITEGTIIRWLKKEGDKVEQDEVLLEISTDKVDSEIPSPHAGVVSKILAADGETVQVGTVVAQIDTEAAEVAAAAVTEGATATVSAQPEAVHETTVPEPATAPASAQAETQGNASVSEMLPGEPANASSQGQGSYEMVMPQMGESITEGTVIRWLKKQGDRVKRDEILLEISTDKVDSEIPSPHEGVIQEILAEAGQTVQVGSVIARIAGTGGEANVPASKPAAKTEAVSGAGAPPEAAVAAVREKVAIAAPTRNGTERRFYSPLVRSIARTEGILEDELARIPGTGSHGRVTKKDILNYLDARTGPGTVTTQPAPGPAMPAAPAPAFAQPSFSDDRVEIIPMGTMRKSIAKHMVNSVQTSPHVFMMTEADMTNLVAYRTQNKDAFLQKTGTKLTYMPFITYASAKALQDYPMVNSSLDGENIVRKKYINVGIAVALENNGLIVPVIKSADGLNVVGLARAINDVATRARQKKLKPDEVQDGTFSITNMGSFGSLIGFPIINQPQVAILGIGTIQKRPVVVNDAIAIRSMLYVSLSFDHRLVDGALAGQFLERVAFYLTNFDINSIM